MFSHRTVQRISVNRRLLGSGCRRCGGRECATTFCLANLTSFSLNQSFFVYFRLRYDKEIDWSSYTKLNLTRYVTHEFLYEYLKSGARIFVSLWSMVSAVLQIFRPYIYIPRLKFWLAVNEYYVNAIRKTASKVLTFCWPCISVYLSQYLTNLIHKICFTISFISCLYMSRAHQEVKIVLHSLWYHHTYRCDDTRGCVMQIWSPDALETCRDMK